jgi:hypothetical protein
MLLCVYCLLFVMSRVLGWHVLRCEQLHSKSSRMRRSYTPLPLSTWMGQIYFTLFARLLTLVFRTKISYTYLIPCVCYLSHQSHPPWVYHPTNIRWRRQIMMILSKHFSPVSSHFITLSSKYSLQHPMRNQVPLLHKTRGKIILLYILILIFLVVARKTKDSELYGNKHYTKLICF